jgi:hypothetical protein
MLLVGSSDQDLFPLSPDFLMAKSWTESLGNFTQSCLEVLQREKKDRELTKFLSKSLDEQKNNK